MSEIVPEVVAAVTRVIAEVDPEKLNDREVIAYLAGISETAAGMLKLKPDLKAHADLVMDLANRVFHANKAAEARGYDRAVAEHLAERELFDGVRNDRDQLRQHVQDIDSRMAEATARGYDRAIANLRDDQMYLAWLRGLGADVMPLTQLTPKARLADYLEAEWEAFVAGLVAEAIADMEGEAGVLNEMVNAERVARTTLAAQCARLRQQLDEVGLLRAALGKALQQRDAAIAEAAVLRHRDRRTQAVVEAAQACVVDAQAGGNAIFDLWIDVFEEPGVREGWYRARCDHRECEWTTTGAEPVVEEAAREHLDREHGDLIASAEAAADTVRHVLRLRVGDLQEAPASPPGSTLPAERAPVEALATDGPETQGEPQGAQRTCGAEYTRPGGRQRGDRIVRCDRPEHVAWESHQEGETGVEWYEPEVAAAYGVPVREPRVWNAGDPEPEGVAKVRDCDGDEWFRVDSEWHWTDAENVNSRWDWAPLVQMWAPLTEVLPEPAPAADNDHDPDGVLPRTAFRCREEYVGLNLDPTARIVRCNLPLDHDGDHDEMIDGEPGNSWPRRAKPDGEVPEAGRAGEAQEDRHAAGRCDCSFCEADRQRKISDWERDLLERVAPDGTEGLDAAVEAAQRAATEIYRQRNGFPADVELNPAYVWAYAEAAVRAASPLIERAALLAAADDWMVDWLAEGTGFPENTDAWLKRRATQVGGGQ